MKTYPFEKLEGFLSRRSLIGDNSIYNIRPRVEIYINDLLIREVVRLKNVVYFIFEDSGEFEAEFVDGNIQFDFELEIFKVEKTCILKV